MMNKINVMLTWNNCSSNNIYGEKSIKVFKDLLTIKPQVSMIKNRRSNKLMYYNTSKKKNSR